MTSPDTLPAVLVFCRPYIVAEFRANFEPVWSGFRFHFMTDGKCPGTDDTRRGFYARIRSGAPCTELTPDEIEDIRDRCRLLRNLERSRAAAMIHAMAGTLAERLDEVAPKAVVCHLIDEYILHTLSVLAAHRGIPVLGYCGSYFSGRALVLRDASGAPWQGRKPDAAEAADVLERISAPAFRQDYRHQAGYSRARHVRLVARYHAKRIAYRLKGLIENDPLNMHYLIGPYTADRKRFSHFPDVSLFDDWDTGIGKLKNNGHGKSVYLPLGYYPEATTNYWVANRKMLDYDGMIVRIAAVLAKSCLAVVVKEHVHMLGMRDPALYQALRRIEGVVLVQPEENSNIVLSGCDALLIGSGSGGVEATVRGKPVITWCDTSYWYRPSGARYFDLDDEGSWASTIASAIAAFKPMASEAKLAFVSACLSGTIRVRKGGGVFPHLDVDDMQELLRGMVAATRNGTRVEPQLKEPQKRKIQAG